MLISLLGIPVLTFGQEKGYVETLAGEKIICYGEVELSPDQVIFSNAEGKKLVFKQNKLKSMHLSDRIFINLPVEGKKNRLQEIVAYNDGYLLTVYANRNVDCFAIFTRDLKPVEGLLIAPRGRLGKFRLINEKILPYFGDCQELIRKMYENLYKAMRGSLREDISNFNCSGSILAKGEL